jgi:glycosyltransferase involved in cell wall biosynthesis
MRIALYHNLPSGGAKRTLNEAVKRLASKHHIDAYSLTSANHDFADIRPFVNNHEVFEFNPFPLLSSPFGRLNQAIRLADLLRLEALSRSMARKIEQNDYDINFVHPCRFSKSPSVLSHLHQRSSIYYCQEPLRLLYETMPSRPYDDNGSNRRQFLNRLDPLPALYLGLLKRVDQRNTRKAKRVLVNSDFMREAVNQIYQVDSRTSYHGIDTELFRPLSFAKRNMVLSVGSLTPLKGFDFLIQAMSHLPVDQRPTLVIASNFQNAPEKEYLEQLAIDLDVDLTLLNNVTDEKLVELYNQAKVVAYAPIREPFGLVPLEAMACGTPVVAVREGGINETVIHEQTGLLVDRNPEAFAGAIQALIADPGLAKKYGDCGRPYIMQNWTWDRAVNTLEKHLSTSVNGQYKN